MVGRIAGHYQVLERLGEGGMGEVYRAHDTRLNRFVALKALPPDKVTDPERRARLIREARAVSNLSHPNIVTVHDILRDNGNDFIVMEYVSGETLARKIASHELRLPQIMKYAAQIADALARAHAAGIIHRDLKPSNIMIAKGDIVKVLDFGLAKQNGGPPADDDSTTTALKTRAGVAIGSAGYMSPEQVRGRAIDHRSDIFNFGIILYEMLSGKRAFQGDSAVEVMNAILKEPPADLPATVPSALRKIVADCLEKDPAERFESARDLAFALRAIAGGSGSGISVARLAQAARRSKPSWPKRIAAWAGVAAACLLITGLWQPPAPRAHVLQLTVGANPNSATLGVHDGRILWTSQRPAPNQNSSEFWSISTNGGQPRRERMAFLDPARFAVFLQVNPLQGSIVIVASTPGAQGDEVWLAGFDGSRPRRIGDYPGDSTYGVSPDLKTMVRAAKEGLFARPVEGGPEKLLARVEGKVPTFPIFHPSGKTINFWPLDNGAAKAWEVEADGSGMRPLLTDFPGEQRNASWSPDGERLYFMCRGEIYRLNRRQALGWLRKPKPERLTTGPLNFGFATEDPRNPNVLYSVAVLERGESMKLDKRTGVFEPYLNGLSADSLDFSPDGQWIAYVNYPARELWKCRRDGTDNVQLEEDWEISHPRWSPDGKRLAFAATQKESYGVPQWLYVRAAEGGRAERVPGVSGPGLDPSWSPDGKKLAFAPVVYPLVTKEDRHISIIDLASGSIEPVPGSDEMFNAVWSPDGKRLAALTWDQSYLSIYDFDAKRWTNTRARQFQFPVWSKDSRFIYGLLQAENRLVRIEAATRKVEEIRNIKEFRVLGSVSWTPEWEPIILINMSPKEIYRIELEQ